MSIIIKNVKLFTPPLWVRCGSTRWHWKKQHRHVKHPDRRMFEMITEPIYDEMFVRPNPWVTQCDALRHKGKLEEEEENLYAEFLMRQIKKLFTEHEMILVIHMFNIPKHAYVEQTLHLRRKGLQVITYPNELIQMYIKESKLRNLGPLMSHYNHYVVSTTPQVHDAVTELKKCPDFILLGGMVCDGLYTKAQLEEIATLRPMEDLLAETVATLNAGQQRMLTSLQSHQQTLVTNLSQYAKDLEAKQE